MTDFLWLATLGCLSLIFSLAAILASRAYRDFGAMICAVIGYACLAAALAPTIKAVLS